MTQAITTTQTPTMQVAPDCTDEELEQAYLEDQGRQIASYIASGDANAARLLSEALNMYSLLKYLRDAHDTTLGAALPDMLQDICDQYTAQVRELLKLRTAIPATSPLPI